MIVKILGLMDVISGIVLGLAYYELFGQIAVICALYLLIKGIIFFGSFATWIDLITAIVFFLVIYGVSGVWVWIFIIWLMQKGIFSLLS